jgi:hypothetical protein
VHDHEEMPNDSSGRIDDAAFQPARRECMDDA